MLSKALTTTYQDTAPALRSSPEWLKFFALGLAVRFAFLPLAPNNGTDAWARYNIAQTWLRNPHGLPSKVWLPLHFWLLAGALTIWDSEWSVRALTVLLGALTIVPFWGIARRAFGVAVARWSTLAFALFGFHVGYSVTTSSEAPTIFFLATGVYFWIRLKSEDGWRWLVPGGLAFIAASLCRFEVWIYIATLALLLFDFSRRPRSSRLSLATLRKPLSFGFFASAGAIGWMILSFVKWGDPLASAHGTFAINRMAAASATQSDIYRFIVVPGALVITISPLVAGLAYWGIFRALSKGEVIARSLAILALASFAADYYACVDKRVTMARYTLMYSWLLIPFAFEVLGQLSFRLKKVSRTKVYAAGLSFFVAWQAGIVAGAYCTEYPQIADRLSVVSPTLPLSVELRGLTGWLKKNTTPGDSVVVDQFHYEATDIIRFSGLSLSRSLAIPYPADRAQVKLGFRDFLTQHHPHLLVYCTNGELGIFWPFGDQVDIYWPTFGLHLHRLWKGELYRVYEIEMHRPSQTQDGSPIGAQAHKTDAIGQVSAAASQGEMKASAITISSQ